MREGDREKERYYGMYKIITLQGIATCIPIACKLPLEENSLFYLLHV